MDEEPNPKEATLTQLDAAEQGRVVRSWRQAMCWAGKAPCSKGHSWASGETLQNKTGGTR